MELIIGLERSAFNQFGIINLNFKVFCGLGIAT